MSKKNYFRIFFLVSVLIFLSSCTLEVKLDEMFLSSIDSEKSRIVVPVPAWGVADGSSKLEVRVYARNKEGYPILGFKPVLGVLGDGSHDATCEPLKSEYALCELTVNQGGHKLLYLKNGKVDNLGHAYFYENSEEGSMSLHKSRAASNGFDKLKVSLSFPSKNAKAVHFNEPILFSDSGKPISANCLVPDNSGGAICEVKSDLAGAIEIKTTNLNLKTVTGEFTSPKVKFLNKYGQVGPDGAPARLSIDSVDKPVLETYPDTDSFVCNSAGKDKWLCSMSSNAEGTKVVKIKSTQVNEVVEVYFSNGKSTVEKGASQFSLADGEKEIELVLTLKKSSGEPLKGVMPSVELTGVGQSSIRCLESSEEGISKCFVKSITPGEKAVQVLEPLIKDPATIVFEKSLAYKVIDEVEADGKSFAVFAVYSPEGSETPKLEIEPPTGASISSNCSAPAKIEATDPYRSFCFLTADTAGIYKVNIKSPEAASLSFKFVNYEVFLTFPENEDGSAKADGVDSIKLALNTLGAESNLKSSDIELLFNPSRGIDYSCAPGGTSSQVICSVRSSVYGIVKVRSSHPLSSNEKILRFLNPFGGLATDNPGSGIVNIPNSVTDPKSVAIIYLELKDQEGNPIVGVVPELLIEGSGHSSYICYPSNSDGIARCEITSDEEGVKTITVVKPLLQQPIVINVSSNLRSCTAPFATKSIQVWTGPEYSDWGPCTINKCETNYDLVSNVCTAATRSCSPMPDGAKTAMQIWDSRNLDKTWGLCTISECRPNYTLTPPIPEESNVCVADTRACPAIDLLENFYAGIQVWNGENWGLCKATTCHYPYTVKNDSCSLADTNPMVSGFFVDEVNAIPSEEVVSNILFVSGLDRNVPISLLGGIDGRIEIRRIPGSWTSIGRGVEAEALTDSNKGIKNGDEVRIVAKASSDLLTTTSMTLTIGSAAALDWSITTTAALPPSNPLLTHSPNTKSFTVSWGAGGLGNGGENNCQLQYQKGILWENIGSPSNCDLPQDTMTVPLPGDHWVSDFSSEGISVRLIRLTDSSMVLKFSDKLTCVKYPVMPYTNNPLIDENCNGLWNDEDDHSAPLDGSFTIEATDTGDSSVTSAVQVVLNIVCAQDQAGGVEVAYGNSPNPTNWSACEAQKSHTLTSGSGNKTVYMRFKDAYGNVSDDITEVIALDQSSPTGGDFLINAGAERTALTNIALTINCPNDENGPIEMAYGFSSSPDNWQLCENARSLTLSLGDGLKNVYMRFRDRFKNTSTDITKNIILDQTGPISSLSYANGWVNALTLNLLASSTDAQGSMPFVCSIEAQEAVLSGATVGEYGGFSEISQTCTNTSYNLTSGRAYKFRMRSTDTLGNAGNYVTPNLEVKVDNQIPYLSSVTATTTANQPSCGLVRVTIAGAGDADSGLATMAYSFDGGATWQAGNQKDFTTTAVTLSAHSIKVRDMAGNILSYGSSINGSSIACNCNLPWGGTISDGQFVTAFANSNPVYPEMCQSQTRTCSTGVLTGSYTAQSCSQQYSYSWYESGWGSCPLNSWTYSSTGACSASCGSGSAYATYTCAPATKTRTQTVYCRRNDNTQVADSFCSGAKPATSESCYQTSCSGPNPSGYQSCSNYSGCTYSWSTTYWSTCTTSAGAYCWQGTQTRAALCKRSDGTSVANSYCGTAPATSQTCTATSSCYSGYGSCTEVDHPAGSNTNWYCDTWTYVGDARGGVVCLTGQAVGGINSPKSGLLIHFACWRN